MHENVIPNIEEHFGKSPASKILSIQRMENKVKIVVSFIVPNSCYEFYKFEQIENKITVYSINRKKTVCLQVLSSITKEFEFEIANDQPINYEFWSTDNVYIKAE